LTGIKTANLERENKRKEKVKGTIINCGSGSKGIKFSFIEIP
jgi:hypothetical protein